MKRSKDLEQHHSDSIAQASIEESGKLDAFTLDCMLVFSAVLLVVIGFIFLTTSETAKGWVEASPILQAVSTFLNQAQGLSLLAVFIPIGGGLVETYFGRRSDNLRDATVVNTTFITLLVVLAMYPQVMAGGLSLRIPRVLGFGLYFHVDMLSLTMAVITSLLWLFVMIYSHDYMLTENHRNRFYFFMSITFGAILGTVMAGDILTMFLFFEIMTFSSYMLVSHCENDECIIAGNNYIYMGMLGGLSILFGMILLYLYTNTLEFIPLASKIHELGPVKYWIMGLFIFGFGIKAGMAPVHVWLPRAHPVAPTPASALLSGIMIKIGAYGILRVCTSFLFPMASEIDGYQHILWETSKTMGAGLIWLGIITMGLGVFLALQQSNIKKMLAYHSVSQMGYIVMGIGVAVYLGHKGAMGFSGSVYHIINHALFKSLLFMMAGVIYLKTHQLDMYKLGGFWKIMPFTAIVTIVAALGITGMPGFNGFASKSILHHAIIEAYEYGHPIFRYAEMAFTLISAGTVCSFIKLFGFVFLGKLPEKYKDLKGSYRVMDMAMGGLGMIIIAIGLKPNYLMDHFIIPAARAMTYDPEFIEHYLAHMNFFNSKDMVGMIWVYLLGALIFYVGIKFHLFHLHFPKWLRVEYIVFYPLNKTLQWLCGYMARKEVSNHAICSISAQQEELAERQEGTINRFISTINMFTEHYEMGFIRSDVVIYTVVLTGVLGLLIFFG